MRGLCVWTFFFFFKQKTAYELRISDWSSDVCSSDLAGEDQGGGCRDRPKKKSNAAHRTFTSAATTSSNSWAPNCRNGLPFTKDVGVARVSVVCIYSA